MKIKEIMKLKYINLNINHNLRESDIDIIDVRSQLKHQIQVQETKKRDGYLIKMFQ